MNINQYLKTNAKFREVSNIRMRDRTPRVECMDGFSMSVQVSEYHYCSPRWNDAEYYDKVEVGFPTEDEELLLPYKEEMEVPEKYRENGGKDIPAIYPYVPVRIVDKIIEKHGGIKNE